MQYSFVSFVIHHLILNEFTISHVAELWHKLLLFAVFSAGTRRW